MSASPPARVRSEITQLVVLAAPLAAAHAGQQLMSLVDTGLVGRLGSTEVGAVGLAGAVFGAFLIMGMGIVMGLDPLMAQAFGAADGARARRLLWQGAYLSLIVSCAVAMPMWLLPEFFTSWGIEAQTARLAGAYIRIRSVSLWPVFFFIAVRGYLQALGRTRPLITAIVVANVVNFLAGWLFVFGGSRLPSWLWPLDQVPSYGVAGIAGVTAACSFVQLLVVLPALRQGVRQRGAPLARPDRENLRRAFTVGLPLALQMGAEVGVFALVGVLAARLGTTQLAAHQIAIQVASLSFTVSLGVGAAGSVRVGRAIGARDEHGVRLAGMVAFACGGIFMALSAATMFAFPRALASTLTDQPDLIAASLTLLRVAAFFQLSDGIQAVGAGVLRGAGDTRFLSIINIAAHYGIGLPVAIALGFPLGYGITGLWWGLCTGLSVVAIGLFLRFRTLSSRPIEPLVATR